MPMMIEARRMPRNNIFLFLIAILAIRLLAFFNVICRFN
jgi:hypothetical protein